jgi:hypothetical protein
MKKEKYFKCKFCKVFCRKTSISCLVENLDGNWTCAYGTGLSIYRWLVRLLTGLIPVPALVWALFRISKWTKGYDPFNDKTFNLVDCIAQIILILSVIGVGVLLAWFLIGVITNLQYELHYKNGSIWGKK